MSGLWALLAIAAAPELAFEPPSPGLGEPAIVYVRGTGEQSGRLAAFGFAVALHPVGDGLLRGLLPIPLDEAAGAAPVKLFVGKGPRPTLETRLVVRDRRFRTSELKVNPQFTSKKQPKKVEARIRRERKAWAAAMARPSLPPQFSGGFVRPVDSATTSEFGVRRTFNGKLASTHYGLDLDGAIGDPVKVIQAGRVILSADRWASGGTVLVDHGGGLYSAYFHLSARDVKTGAVLVAGQRIGAVGKTGRVTGPHLHLSILVRVREPAHSEATRTYYVDPAALLSLSLAGEVIPQGNSRN